MHTDPPHTLRDGFAQGLCPHSPAWDPAVAHPCSSPHSARVGRGKAQLSACTLAAAGRASAAGRLCRGPRFGPLASVGGIAATEAAHIFGIGLFPCK